METAVRLEFPHMVKFWTDSCPEQMYDKETECEIFMYRNRNWVGHVESFGASSREVLATTTYDNGKD